MARFDPDTRHVVIRLVYDGPAWAGKTTTLRSLARSLGSTLTSGAEADGRTLQFDWVDYVGGLFQGLPIQCQIVGVPGQRVLERRRFAILESADAVVFVADSRASQAGENVRSFEGLREALRDREPPVATVVQANKRDLPDSLPLDTVRSSLGAAASLAMTESVAETGEGVRETFVLAVRLALDRVRALWDGDGLPRDGSPVAGAAELLAGMLDERPATTAPTAVHRALATDEVPDEVPSDEEPFRLPPAEPSNGAARGPRRPDSSIPPGLVWPPVHGRVIVHESAREPLVLSRTSRGDWAGDSSTWRTASPVEALFFDLDQGRQALIAWARWHTAAGDRLSPSRAIVLAEAAPGAWRLWQILRRVPTLREAVQQAARSDEPTSGERLLALLELRLHAEREMVHSGWVEEVSLDNLSLSEHGLAAYADLIPYAPSAGPAAEIPPAGPEAELQRIVDGEVVPALAESLRTAPERLAGLLVGLDAAATTPERQQIAGSVRQAILRA